MMYGLADTKMFYRYIVILFLTLITTFSAEAANINGTKPVKLIETNDIVITSIVCTGCLENVFNLTEYDAKSENFVFNSDRDISKLKIFDKHGQLEFELIVKSNRFKLNRNIFFEGTYTLSFDLEDSEEVFLAEVVIR